MESAPTPQEQETLPHALAQPKSRWSGKGFLAVCMTFIFPGAGHWLAGRRARAVKCAAIAIAIQLVGSLILANAQAARFVVIVIPATLLAALWLLLDAFRCGTRSDQSLLGRRWLRYTTGIVLLGATPFVSPWKWISESLASKLKLHYVDSFHMNGNSMLPTLQPDDRFLVHKGVDIDRWIIVLFPHPEKRSSMIVSRVVGLPGERIAIKKTGLYIDDQLVTPPAGAGPYVVYPYSGHHDSELVGKPGAGCESNPILLGNDEYYLLGDNSTRALDSRLWETAFETHQLGAVPRSVIRGRVTLIYWPPQRYGVPG